MADGKTHAAANRTVLKWTAGLSLSAMAITQNLSSVVVGIGQIFGSWVGLICTPDIDHHMTTVEEIRMKRINPILGALWQLYWTPYQIAIPHAYGRRSKWSHAPVFPGTFIRFVYLLWLPLMWTYSQVDLQLYILFWASAFIGQSIQDIRHAQLDKWGYK